MRVAYFTNQCDKKSAIYYYHQTLLKKIKEKFNAITENHCKPESYNADIAHITNQTAAYYNWIIPKKKPIIITVHDIIPLEAKEEYHFLKRSLYQLILTGLNQKNTSIISISNTTKNKLIKKLSIDENKIHVVYNGIEDKMYYKPREDLPKTPLKILYVGNEKDHKKVDQIIDIIAGLKDIGIPVKFTKVGQAQSTAGRKKVLQKIKEYNLRDNVEFKEHISYEELIKEYRNNDIFISMSELEGFGMPPLEAMANGMPVILKNMDTFRELYGEIGTLVNSVKDAIKLIKEIYDSESKYISLSKMSYKIARKYNINSTVENTYKIYQEIV